MPDEGARVATRPTISAEWAGQMMDAAVARARSMSVGVTVVVVDESGVLKGMPRMDGAPLVSVQTAVRGPRTPATCIGGCAGSR
jgi:uncharacterized protein GlcG (DUF336 family)